MFERVSLSLSVNYLLVTLGLAFVPGLFLILGSAYCFVFLRGVVRRTLNNLYFLYLSLQVMLNLSQMGREHLMKLIEVGRHPIVCNPGHIYIRSPSCVCPASHPSLTFYTHLRTCHYQVYLLFHTSQLDTTSRKFFTERIETSKFCLKKKKEACFLSLKTCQFWAKTHVFLTKSKNIF